MIYAYTYYFELLNTGKYKGFKTAFTRSEKNSKRTFSALNLKPHLYNNIIVYPFCSPRIIRFYFGQTQLNFVIDLRRPCCGPLPEIPKGKNIAYNLRLHDSYAEMFKAWITALQLFLCAWEIARKDLIVVPCDFVQREKQWKSHSSKSQLAIYVTAALHVVNNSLIHVY